MNVAQLLAYPVMRLATALLLILGACGDRLERQTLTLELRVPEAAPCRPPGAPTNLVVEALGDFPASDERTIDVLRPADGSDTIDRFPPGTRMLTIRAQSERWSGFGAAPLPAFDTGARALPMLLLPPEESCLLADPALADRGGAAVATLDGGLVLLGGREGSVGSRRVVHWRSGELVAEVVDPGLQVRRAGVAAIRSGDRVFALGGALGDEGPAHDTFEIYDAGAGATIEGLQTLLEPRRDAGAARLPSGDVLLVGGRATGGGEPLATAEELEVTTRSARPAGELPVARAEPLVRVLDDGSVVVVGGVGPGGGAVRELVAFDPRSGTFVDLGLSLESAPVAAVPLPGGRLLVVGATAELTLLRNAPPILGPVPGLVEEPLTITLPPLTDLAATALFDGRVLITGIGLGDTARALAVDVGQGTWEELPAPRARGRLVTLADGATMAFDGVGAAVRRVSERFPFGNPPASLLAEDLALDARARWRTDGAALVAEATDARADLAGLRFADVAVELETTGEVELLLQPEGAPATAIRIDDDEAGPSLCTLTAGGPLTVERRGDALVLERGGERLECRLEELPPRVALALRARRGARFERIEVRRLETAE